jgi:hypothetical protein
MNKEYKQKWVEALRSGEYKQGKGVLRSKSDEYCCLGVLCDIVDPEGWTTPDSACGRCHFDDQSTVLPLSIAERVGLGEDQHGKLQRLAGGQEYLTECNDDGMTFEVIADIIEEQF